MSYISSNSSHKKLPLWKVSDQAKNSNKQLSVIHPSTRLPQRFSPAKKDHNQSKLFNTSMQKQKRMKLQYSKDRTPAVKTNDRNSTHILEHHHQASSSMINPVTPRKQDKIRKINFNSRDSCFSLFSDQVKNISSEGLGHFIHEYEVNRKMILVLKEEFIQLRLSVLQQLNNQKKMVMQFMIKIHQLCNQTIKNQSNPQYEQLEKIVSKNNQETTNRTLNFYNLIQSFQQTEKKLQPQLFFQANQQKSKFQQKKFQKKLYINTNYEENQAQLVRQDGKQQPKQSQEVKQHGSSKKSSPHLEKCNQIVQTINMLNQINASPINRAKNATRNNKSNQKLKAEDHKQKILLFSKSNDSLINEKLREGLFKNEQKTKSKGSFKLEKFYNAIEKLKQEVNQIQSTGIEQPKSHLIKDE